MAGSMNIKHSRNWSLLFKLLNNQTGEFNHERIPQLSAHLQAKALSIFLANASLATPALDRDTVTAIISGKQSWPCSDGSESLISSDLPLSIFEDAGLLSFYADWCGIHAQKVTDVGAFDQNLQDILQVVEHLRCLWEGDKGHIQPHFAIKKDELQNLLSENFGNTSLKTLLPQLEEGEEVYFILPERREFSQLHSTYLWKVLFQQLPAEEAFRRWLLCSKVHGRGIIPVQFGFLEEEERQAFLLQVETFFSTDPAMNYPLKGLFKQTVNARNLRRILEPRNYVINVHIGSGKAESKEIVKSTDDEKQPLTLEMLESSYRYPGGEDFTNFSVLAGWSEVVDIFSPVSAFTWLFRECIDYSLTISHSSLNARPFVDNVLTHTESCNILKFILFCGYSLRQNTKYLLYLLSRTDTRDIAFFHLTNREYLHEIIPVDSFVTGIEKNFRDLLITEYLLSTFVNEDRGASLLNAMLYLADNCGFYSNNHSDSIEYRIISELLSRLDDNYLIQLASAFIRQPLDGFNDRIARIRERSLYYLGFRVLERIEELGIPGIEALRCALREYLLNFYQQALNDSFTGIQRDLKPDEFYSSLPWWLLVQATDVKPLLIFSTNHLEWGNLLGSDKQNSYRTRSAISQYTQVLMCIVNADLDTHSQQRVWRRITDIINTHGFGSTNRRLYLFTGYVNEESRLLWKTFCLFLNKLSDSLYDDFFERCSDKIPVNALYEQLALCNIIERKMVLQELILTRSDVEGEGLSLSALDDAFVAACAKGHMNLAYGINKSAQKIVERLRPFDNHHFHKSLVRWEGYTYKYKLLSYFLTSKDNPAEFERLANSEAVPVIPGLNQQNIAAKDLRTDCEQFRIYIIATAFCDIDPEKCIRFMEPLVRESKVPHHIFLLFKGRVVFARNNNDHALLKYALNHFLIDMDNKKPEEMDVQWVGLILTVLHELRDKYQADSFWRELTSEQRRTREVLLPYCKILIDRREYWNAKQILDDFQKLNPIISDDDSGLIQLIEQLSKELPDRSPITEIMRAVVESNQRSVQQLKQHYASIVSCSFNDYVEIVGRGVTSEEFLKDIVIEVANEILMRKTNLQIQVAGKVKGSTVQKIVGEDLINDWFTSLFDKRMAEARIGFRDQKRAGRSAAGENPGESDGVITHATNTRIAIFEAFRLFSCSRKTIEEHLNKISGYDQEALSPVFVVAYCDVNNFVSLITNYGKIVSSMSYAGFTCVPDSIETLEKTDQLWIGREVCFRNSKEVVFYHLLLNMR